MLLLNDSPNLGNGTSDKVALAWIKLVGLELSFWSSAELNILDPDDLLPPSLRIDLDWRIMCRVIYTASISEVYAALSKRAQDSLIVVIHQCSI